MKEQHSLFAPFVTAAINNPVRQLLPLNWVLVLSSCAMCPPKSAICAELIGWKIALPKNWN